MNQIREYRFRIATRVEVDAVIHAEDPRAAAEQLGVSLPYLAADLERAVGRLGDVNVDEWKIGRARPV